MVALGFHPHLVDANWLKTIVGNVTSSQKKSYAFWPSCGRIADMRYVGVRGSEGQPGVWPDTPTTYYHYHCY